VVVCQDSNGEAAPGSSGETGRALRQACSASARWLERIAGSNVASAGKGSWHGKLSSFRHIEQLLHAGSERHAAAAASGGLALMLRQEPD
jgi:hypothetical protein